MEETVLNVSHLSFQVIMDDKIVKSIELALVVLSDIRTNDRTGDYNNNISFIGAIWFKIG